MTTLTASQLRKSPLYNSYILITGATGFTGSHLTERLCNYSKNIIVTYRKLNPDRYFFLQGLSKKVHMEKIDIRNKKKVLNLSHTYPIDYIVHFAANTDVTDAYYNPEKTIDVSVNGTLNILELTRSLKDIKGVIIVSSDKAYGKTRKIAKEVFPLTGDHPYEVAKAATDLFAQSYIKTYNLPIAITRFGNIYGPGDTHFERIVPGICKSIINRSPFIIRGNGKNIRNYIFIEDAIDGYIMLLEKFQNIKGHAYNFASHDALSALDVIRLFEKKLHIKVPYTIANTAVNEIPYQTLNTAKASKLGLKTKYTMENTIKKIFAWYQNFLTQ